MKQNKTTYLTDYADGIDENFGKVVFRSYFNNPDRYQKMPENLKNYFATYCPDDKKRYEEIHHISNETPITSKLETKIDPEILGSSKVLQAVIDYKEKNPDKFKDENPSYITDDGYML